MLDLLRQVLTQAEPLARAEPAACPSCVLDSLVTDLADKIFSLLKSNCSPSELTRAAANNIAVVLLKPERVMKRVLS